MGLSARDHFDFADPRFDTMCLGPSQNIPLAATMLLKRTSVGLSLSLKDLGLTADLVSAIFAIDE
jgi:hypothetical protein